MKKYFASMLLSAAAIVSATMLVSCGEDDDNNGMTPDVPEVKVETGKYSLTFTSIHISDWPDANTGIEDQYKTYQKSITDALNIDLNKKYDWSDIEADKDRLTKEFDKFGDFEYKVKSLRNYFLYYGGETSLSAKKDGSDQSLKIGTKNVKCIKEIPDDVTAQLYLEISSYETDVPSINEYCEKLRDLYIEALKEEFTGEYGTEVKGQTRNESFYYNMANYTTDGLEVKTRVNKICEAVELPALPDDVKEKALAITPALSYLFKILINTYDPKVPYPIKSEDKVFSLTVHVE